jgi:glutamine cyclotransferase
MAIVSKSMTVSTIKARAMRSFGHEDGDCKGFRNINKSVICGKHWNEIFEVKLLMF